jgi:O-antigen/teichoic acid export membrane protein
LGQPIVDLKHQLTSLKSIFLGQGDTTSLRGRAMNSGAWIGAGFAVQKALQFGSNLILTRLLFPEAFGLMALATVFLVGLAMFSDVGIKPAIIRDPRGDDPDFLNTAWTIQVLRGIMLFAIAVAISYPVSLIYGQAILFPLLCVLSITALINGFSSISLVTAERKLDFRSVTFVQIAGQAMLIGLLVSIAYFWRSVWALAVANVIGSLATVLLGYVLLPRHRHRFVLDKAHALSLMSFGKWIFLSTIVSYLGGEGLRAVQAAMITPAEFGVLAIANTIAAIPNDLALRLAGSIGLPVMAETYRESPAKASSILHQFRKHSLTISMAMFASAAIPARELIQFLYDARYHNAGEYLIAACLANAVASIGFGYSGAILAVGSFQSYFISMLIITLLRIIGVLIGFQFGGIMGMIIGIAIANLVSLIYYWYLTDRLGLRDFRLDFTTLLGIAALSAISLR